MLFTRKFLRLNLYIYMLDRFNDSQACLYVDFIFLGSFSECFSFFFLNLLANVVNIYSTSLDASEKKTHYKIESYLLATENVFCSAHLVTLPFAYMGLTVIVFYGGNFLGSCDISFYFDQQSKQPIGNYVFYAGTIESPI